MFISSRNMKMSLEDKEKVIATSLPSVFPWRGKHNPRVEVTFPELTWKCPRQAYPDFGKITIMYVVNRDVLELKSFKLWCNSFRDRYIGHEKVADEIHNTLKELLQPILITTTLEINPRGNVKSTITICG